MNRFRSILVGAVFMPVFTLAAFAGDQADITFEAKGIRIIHNGVTLLTPEDGLAKVLNLRQPKADGGFDQLWEPRPTDSAWAPETHSSRQVFDWGLVQVDYAVKGSRLDCLVRVSNATDRTIAPIEIWPLRLRLPRTRQNLGSTADALGTVLTHDGGVVGLINENPGIGCQVRREFPNAAGAYPIELENRPAKTAHHPIVDNTWFNQPGTPIGPGASVAWTVSLVFGPSGASIPDLVPDLYERYRKANPVSLKWPDRRPIGTIFWSHPWQRWPTNPRGFNFGFASKHDVFSEAGLKVFGEELLRYVDNSVAISKAMDAQGVIIWDLEGEEMWHPATYVADPAKLSECAPEMERFADEVFKRFREAGLRTGITIRPTEYFRKAEALYNWSQRDVRDPVRLMADKIAYARKRWGCTLFYLDSNVFGDGFDTKLPKDSGVPWTMPAAMIEALHKQFPDVLVIPEWSYLDYHRWSATYASCNLGDTGSDARTRAVYPQSFRVVAVNTTIMENNWETFVRNVGQGDVLLFPAWYPAPENRLVKWIFQEGEFQRRPFPAVLIGAGVETLAAKASDPDEFTAYSAVTALGQKGSPEAIAPLIQLLSDGRPLIRKQVLTGLALAPKLDDPACITLLTSWLMPGGDPVQSSFRNPTARALARGGEAMVPGVLALLGDDTKAPAWPYAIQALGHSGTTNILAANALVAFLSDGSPAKAGLRLDAIASLGLLKAKSAVPSLLPLLDKKDRESENERGAVVKALGQIGDERAIEPLIRYFDVGHSTVVVYWIPDALENALHSITGVKNVVGKEDWKRWFDARQNPAP